MQAQTSPETTRRRIDITDLPADAVDEYARAQGDELTELSLERRGPRTYLVVSL